MYKIVLKNKGEISDILLAGDIYSAYKVAMPPKPVEKQQHWHAMMWLYAESQINETPINVPLRVAWQDQVDDNNDQRESFIIKIDKDSVLID